MQTITQYRAFDGQMFDAAEDCRAHESKYVETRLVALTIEQVRAALDRTDIDLADAIEAVGVRITKRRYEMGEKRRTRKGGEQVVAAEAAPDDADLSPAYRGDRDFKAGNPGIVPDDLQGDPDKAEAYLKAWDAASLAAGQQRQVAA